MYINLTHFLYPGPGPWMKETQMEIDEIKRAKKKLEFDLFQAVRIRLEEFEAQTGIYPKEVLVHLHESSIFKRALSPNRISSITANIRL